MWIFSLIVKVICFPLHILVVNQVDSLRFWRITVIVCNVKKRCILAINYSIHSVIQHCISMMAQVQWQILRIQKRKTIASSQRGYSLVAKKKRERQKKSHLSSYSLLLSTSGGCHSEEVRQQFLKDVT